MKASNYRRRVSLRFRAYLSGLVPLLLLLVSMIAHAQVTTLVSEQRVDVMDGNSRRGELIYSVTLEGAKHLGDQSFEFTSLGEVKMKLIIRVEGKNSKWTSRMKIGIGQKAFGYHEESMWKTTAVAPFRIAADDGKTSIVFYSTKEGVSNLILPFTFLDIDDGGQVNEADWSLLTVQNRITLPRLTLRKAAPEVKPETDKLREDLATMFAFYKNTANEWDEREQMRKNIVKAVTDDFREMVIQDEAIPTSEGFVNKYAAYTGKGFTAIDEHVRRARLNIVEVKAALEKIDEREDPVIVHRASDGNREEREWRQLFLDRDTARLLAYLDAEGSRLTEERLNAGRDSLHCWSAAGYLVRDRIDGRQLIELTNFVSPAYFDVYGGSVHINDDRLRDEHLLSIEIRGSERISLLIVDKGCPGKSIEIPLDNLLRAEMTIDSVGGTYRIKFSGGSKPYTLKLLADSTDKAVWFQEGIRVDELVLTTDSLQTAGLRGHLNVEAYSSDSDTPVAVSGGMIFVPSPPPPRWILPLLIALTIGGLALLVLYILRRGKRGRTDIFSKA